MDMPLYEYFCTDCDEPFELLRPTSQAAKPQACPECDQDAPRRVSQFQAFTMRAGYPRRIPDDGTAWHLGKKVRGPVSQPTLANTHPEHEAKRIRPPTPPTVEEFELHQHAAEQLAEEQATDRPGVRRVTNNPDEEQLEKFNKRVRQTAGQAKQARRATPNKKLTARTRTGKHSPTPKSKS
jgi:putative FmdB family regulatory protein